MEQGQIDLINLSNQSSLLICFVGDGCIQYSEQLFNIFSEHGPPDRIQSNNGNDFKKDVKKFCCSHSVLLL